MGKKTTTTTTAGGGSRGFGEKGAKTGGRRGQSDVDSFHLLAAGHRRRPGRSKGPPPDLGQSESSPAMMGTFFLLDFLLRI
jgi:hypothetical protein